MKCNLIIIKRTCQSVVRKKDSPKVINLKIFSKDKTAGASFLVIKNPFKLVNNNQDRIHNWALNLFQLL